MKISYGVPGQPQEVVEGVKIASFPDELKPTAMRQLVYNIIISEKDAGYTGQELGIIYNAVSSIDIRPYIMPVCNKDSNAIFLLCTELYNLLTISSICIDQNHLYNALIK